MGTDIFSFSRMFQVWQYTVGHGQLLLRSTRTTAKTILPTRIDVLFKDVGAVNMLMALDSLTVTNATEQEVLEMHLPVDPAEEGRKTYIVRDSRFTGYVIAGAVAWHEDELEYNDPSYFKIDLWP